MAAVSLYIRDYEKEIPGELSDSTWCFPSVESVNSHGRKMVWRIYVKLFRMRDDINLPNVPDDAFIPILPTYFKNETMPNDIRGWIKVDSGVENGKVRESVPTIVHKGKNLGKASATNVFCQSLRDAFGLYNKQLKKARSAKSHGKEIKVTLYPPMLAQILKDQKTPPKIDEQNHVFVQRKYNGVRTVATLADDVIMYSRRKLIYPGFGYIKDELKPIFEFYWGEGQQLYLDGEIYKHGVPLQDISGYARKETQPGDKYVDYMVYDCFIANEPELKFSERKKILDEIFENFELKYVLPVETFEVSSTGEIDELYDLFIEEGYEGAMVRIDTKYEFSYNERHSKVLLKKKPSYDAEFKIIGWTCGAKGKAAGALMIICETEKGVKFNVTPAMELPDRLAMAKKMEEKEPNGKTHFENHWLGKPLIVEYDEISKDGVPQRARTKMVIRTWH